MNNISHHFFTREGGVSEGLYTSLNVGIGSKDVPANVTENRTRAAAHFGLDHEALATVHQVHSPTVVVLNSVPAIDKRPEADGMVTRHKNIILGILTADCVPVLFYDSVHGVIGAAHAGWKGAYAGVIHNTINAMEGLGAVRTNIHALTGPAITQESYEVGEEFLTRLTDERDDNAQFFVESGRTAHYLFDLKGYVTSKLRREQIASIDVHADDTRALEHKYFSYRRSCLKNEPDYGRQISCIVMKG